MEKGRNFCFKLGYGRGKKVNILHMIFTIEKGGAETYLFNILDNIDKNINFFVICDHEGGNHKKLKEKCKNIDIIKMKSPFDFKAARNIASYCKANNINIIQTHFLRENYIAVLSKIFNPKIKIIWTAHLIAENNKKIKFFNRLFSKFVNKIICVSHAVKKSLEREGISSEKIKVIYNGVDTDRYKPIENCPLKEELGLNENILVLTTVSRFNKEKGHSFLIEGIKELKNYMKDFKLLLVGSGEEEKFIKQKVENCGLEEFVLFLGYREDIIDILSITDIYLSPSKSEAISFSILEALSCEKVVVATEVGGVPEILEKGNIGILIPYGEPKKFAEAIIYLYENNHIYEMKKSNSRKVVLDHFSLDKMIKETLNLYKELLINKGLN